METKWIPSFVLLSLHSKHLIFKNFLSQATKNFENVYRRCRKLYRLLNIMIAILDIQRDILDNWTDSLES